MIRIRQLASALEKGGKLNTLLTGGGFLNTMPRALKATWSLLIANVASGVAAIAAGTMAFSEEAAGGLTMARATG